MKPVWKNVTPSTITKIVLPIGYLTTGVRLIAVLRSSRDPAVRDLAIALAAVAAASSTLPPSALDTFEEVTGDANIGRFLSQVGTVVAAGAGNSVMQRSAHDPDRADEAVRKQRLDMFSTVAVMGAFFARNRALAAEMQQPTSAIRKPATAVYWVYFSAFMGRSVAQTAHLALSTSRVTLDDSLKWGLRGVAGASAVLSAFYTHVAVLTVGAAATRRLPEPLRGVPAQAIIGACAGTIALGASYPGMAWRSRRLLRAISDAVAAWRLRRIWRPLQGARTDLYVPVSVLNPEVRLQRRVIEILDGLDALGSQVDADGWLFRSAQEVGRDYNLSTDDVVALYRAALIVKNVSGSESAEASTRVLEDLDHLPPSTGGEVDQDWRQEARRLQQTSTLLDTSPLPALVTRPSTNGTQEVRHAPRQ